MEIALPKKPNSLSTDDERWCGYVHLTEALGRTSLMPVDNEAVIFI